MKVAQTFDQRDLDHLPPRVFAYTDSQIISVQTCGFGKDFSNHIVGKSSDKQYKSYCECFAQSVGPFIDIRVASLHCLFSFSFCCCKPRADHLVHFLYIFVIAAPFWNHDCTLGTIFGTLRQ